MISVVLVTCITFSITIAPLTYAAEKIMRSTNHLVNKTLTTTVVTNKQSQDLIPNQPGLPPSTSTTQTVTAKPTANSEQPTLTPTVGVTTNMSDNLAQVTQAPDSASAVLAVAEQQTNIATLPVVYKSSKLNNDAARLIVMVGSVSTIIGGMLFTLTYLDDAKRYRTLSSPSIR